MTHSQPQTALPKTGKAVYFLVTARIFIGLLFVVSGLEKLSTPYENFLYVIRGYEIFPYPLDFLAAVCVPWFELISGAFILLGLWWKPALGALWVFTIGMIIVVGQAMARKLPIQECGCFGDLVSVPLIVIFIFDSVMQVVMILLIKFAARTSVFSLDRYFLKKTANRASSHA